MRITDTRLALVMLFLLLPGCGWIQSLRREVDEDDRRPAQLSDYDYYKDPMNRYVPPPPANAADAMSAPIAGTPVDFSGVRARQMRTTVQNFASEAAKNENSLWSDDGQSNYLFARNKLKTPGDLVTVIIEDGLRKDMVDSVRRTLPPEYQDQEIRVPGLTKDAPADNNRAPAAQGDGTAAQAAPASNEPDPADILTAEVLERYPNGNVRVRGIKRVPFKTQVRNIEVVAIVKGTDISEQDVVKSSRFFDQHVELYR